MNKICCFAGHSTLYNYDKIYENLILCIEKLILEENIKEFWVGNYGQFDKLASKAVSDMKRKHSNIQLNLIIPYLTAEINEDRKFYTQNYDNIIIPDFPGKTPHRLKIIKSNEYMIM